MMNNIKPAEYIDAEISEYEGHPLINALEPINDFKKATKLFRSFPVVPADEVSLKPHIRLHAMMRILDKFLYPTRDHLRLEYKVSTMLRRGYLARNIADRSYQDVLNKLDTTNFNANVLNAGSKAFSCSLIGCSGTGKSTAIEKVLGGYEQAIYHSKYQHLQLVWLKLECPHDGTPKSLCINFFRSVDEILSTSYEKDYVRSRSSTEDMLGNIARIAAIHSLGILVIDEIQNLTTSRSLDVKRLLKFFVTLTNVIKVPVFLVGTPNALRLFSPSLSSSRRASQIGAITWQPFSNASKEEGQKSDWENFFSRMWKVQWLAHPTPEEKRLQDLFWEYSQGIAHIAVTLFYLCQVRAVISGNEVITEDLVADVFREELSMVVPMIKALKSGRQEEIEKYSDIAIPVDVIRVADEWEPQLDEDTERQVQGSEKYEKLIELLSSEIDERAAIAAAKQAIAERPELSLLKLVSYIQEMESPKPKSAPKSEKVEPKLVKGDLRGLSSKDATEQYGSMKENNVIIDLSKYIH